MQYKNNLVQKSLKKSNEAKCLIIYSLDVFKSDFNDFIVETRKDLSFISFNFGIVPIKWLIDLAIVKGND